MSGTSEQRKVIGGGTTMPDLFRSSFDLDIKLLRTLCAVVRTGSMSRAARLLAYSQPAVSQHLNRLEERLDCRLIDRTTRPVTITKEGARAARLAEEILVRADALREINAEDRARAEVRIASFPTAAAALLPAAVASARREFPNAHVTIIEAEPGEAIPLLQGGFVDLALIHDYPEVAECDTRNLIAKDLLFEGFRWFVSADDPVSSARRIEPGDLARHHWVGTREPGPADSYNDMLRAIAARSGFEPWIALQTNDTVLAQGMVSQSGGAVLLPEIAGRASRRDVAACDMSGWTPSRRTRAVRRPGSWASPALEAVASALQAMRTRALPDPRHGSLQTPVHGS
jgi:DNA-binding transcriptional LysR family regulator